MNRMKWVVLLVFALATVPAQAQGFQGGPGNGGLNGLNGNRPGAGIMGGDPAGVGMLGGPRIGPQPPFGGFPNSGTLTGSPGAGTLPGPEIRPGGNSGTGMLGGPGVSPQPRFGGFQGSGAPKGQPITGQNWPPPLLAENIKPDTLIPEAARMFGRNQKAHRWEWPAWAGWQSALGLFAVCMVVGFFYGRFGPED
jgi:hypothetical protein